MNEEYKNLKYGNISQTYSFTIDINFDRLKVSRSEVEKILRKAGKIIRYDDWKLPDIF